MGGDQNHHAGACGGYRRGGGQRQVGEGDCMRPLSILISERDRDEAKERACKERESEKKGGLKGGPKRD